MPHSVIVGFTAGAAVLIINSQTGTLLDMDIPRGTDAMQTLQAIASQALSGQVQFQSIAFVLIILGVIHLRNSLNKYVPAIHVAVIVGAIAAAVIELVFQQHAQFKYFRNIPGAFPPLSQPDLNVATLQQLFGATLIMMLLASTETMATLRAIVLLFYW